MPSEPEGRGVCGGRNGAGRGPGGATGPSAAPAAARRAAAAPACAAAWTAPRCAPGSSWTGTLGTEREEKQSEVGLKESRPTGGSQRPLFQSSGFRLLETSTQ